MSRYLRHASPEGSSEEASASFDHWLAAFQLAPLETIAKAWPDAEGFNTHLCKVKPALARKLKKEWQEKMVSQPTESASLPIKGLCKSINTLLEQ